MTTRALLPHGGGLMGAAVRAHDWSATSLGPIEGWPAPLRTALDLMLNSPESMYLLWGPDLTFLFNDAYRPILGPRLDGALGQPVRVLWADAWEAVRPSVEHALAGKASRFEDLEVGMARHGEPERTWWSFSFSPIHEADDSVGGVLCFTTETTARVVAARALQDANAALARQVEERTAEARRYALLYAIGERLADLGDADAVMAEAGHLLGGHLAAARVGFADLSPDGATARNAGEWTTSGIAASTGRHEVARFGEGFAADLAAGSTVAVSDVAADPRTAPGGAAFERLGIGALVVAPVLRAGRPVAALYVHAAAPRAWSPGDVDLIEAVAQRAWVAVERARGEENRRDAERRLANALASARLGTFAWDAGSGELEMDPRAREILGFPLEGEIRADEVFALIAPDQVGPIAAAATAGAAEGRRIAFDYDIVLPGGEVRHVTSSAEPIEDAAGRRRMVGVLGDATEAERAERALRESEARLAGMFEQAPTFMALLDGPEHRFVRVNPGYMRLVGGRPTLGLTVAEALPEVVGQGFVALLDRVFRTGEAYAANGARVDLRAAPDAPADERYLDFVYQPLRDALGRVTGIFVEGADVTERVRAEAALRALNADLERKVTERALARGRTWQVSPDLIGVLNAEGYFEASNPAWGAVLGWSEEEVARTVFFDFIHPEDLPKTQAAWADAVGRGLPALRFENRYRTKDGRWRWLSWVAVPDDGKVYCSARDVTADKEREEELAARTAERDRMWETSPDLMLILDFAGVFRRVNPAWTAILGYAPEELVGHHVNEFVVAEDHRETTGAYELAARGGLPVIENRYRHKDGSLRWISWVAAPARNMTYATGRDVTAEKARAAELAAAQEQLRQAQKMEAVGQLTGGLAHDVNNMLQGIGGALQMIEKRVEGGRLADVPRLVKAGQEGVDRAAALTHRLLAFARRGRLETRPVIAGDLVEGMADLVRRTVGPGIEVRTRLRDGGQPVVLDPSGLESAILNLAINARDAMPDGGILTLGTGEVRLAAADLAVDEDVPPGEFALISVADTGIGIAPDVLARVFEPFFTTKPIGKGTGLGLSQVYGFVRQSGGIVRVESPPREGTTVRLYLPRAEAATNWGEATARPKEPAPDAAGRTVLLVEDEAAVRALVAEMLRDQGYAVLEAEDGPSGLAALAGATRVDLLVTDVGLPGLNGRQMADAARERRPTLPVLFITGYAGVALDGGLPPGMEAIAKPFSLDDLAERVAGMLVPAV